MALALPVAVFLFLLAAPFLFRSMIPAAALDRESHFLIFDIAALKIGFALAVVPVAFSAAREGELEIAPAIAAAALLALFVSAYANLLWRRWR